MHARRWIGLAAMLVMAAAGGPASAQSAYVGAVLVGDVVLRTHSESSGAADSSAGGEAIGFALRLGAPIGRRWGVDLEFARPGQIETDFASGPIPLVRAAGLTNAMLGVGAARVLAQPFVYRVRTRERYTTLAASAWAQQELSRRVSLVYLAGMGFYRATHETEFGFDGRGGIGAPFILPPGGTTTVTYGVRPLAGLEARIELTDHVELVPGLRFHGLEGAWLLRPAVGLMWAF